mgnify:CR=1 FL=1
MKFKNIVTMKKSYHLIIQIFLLIIVTISFPACNDEIKTGQDLDVRGVSIIPNPVEIGQKISINGLNFHNATSIVFPGNITESTFDKVGDHQLDVIVPSGTVSGGNIIVKLPDGDFTIPIEFKLLEPVVTGTFAVSGAPNIGPHESLIIVGKDLINVSEIIFPGPQQATVREMDFTRKGNEEIIVVVPGGTEKTVSSMILKTRYGKEFQSTNVDFTGGGYIPPEYKLLCGDDGSGKTWAWDEELEDGMVYGNGGYRSNVMPAWWKVHIESLSAGVSAQDALGAKMFFSFSYDGNVMIKTFVDGTHIEGFYKLDMTKKVNMSNGSPWSIGRFEITGGDPELTILGGIGSRWGTLKGFDILKLNENELVLANEYPDEPGTAAYYVFRVKN